MNQIHQTALNYAAAGYSLTPIKLDGTKQPCLKEWKPYQGRRPAPAEIDGWYGSGATRGIGLICGAVSGNLETLDVDEPELIEPLFALIEEHAPGLTAKLVIVETPRGGRHLVYRCAEIAPNQKLALREVALDDIADEEAKRQKAYRRKSDGKWCKTITLIETRGEGGYIVAPGSPARCHPTGREYRLLQGDFSAVPMITPQERAVMLDCARGFNEHVKKSRERQVPKLNNGLKPGADFNEHGDVDGLLQRHGWQSCGQSRAGTRWTRPGGDRPSATLFNESRKLYVFSTNAAPLEFDRAYSPFALLAALEHGDDFQAAAKALATEGYGEKRQAKAAVKPETEHTKAQPPTAEQPTSEEPELKDGYQALNGGLVLVKSSGAEKMPLTNFVARIIADVVRDDGAETSRVFEIEATLNGQTSRGEVSADKFSAMGWPTDLLGAKAIIYPNRKEHARVAIQTISDDIKPRRVYAHTGWREIDGAWCYLHGGGAIGSAGQMDVDVKLSSTLAPFKLPAPPQGDELHAAIRAEIELLDVAPYSITVPAVGGVWAAITGEPDFSEFLEGNTGWGKTQLGVIQQQHCGQDFSERTLPGNWMTTANANAEIAHEMKDAVMVVDDFKPTGTAQDVARLHKDADRLLRGQGNRAGRGRLRSDSTMRSGRAPRGLIVGTGEDVPKGESLRARMLVLRYEKDTTNWPKLTECQRAARKGVYAQVTAAFIQWLAPQYDALRAEAQDKIEQYRDIWSKQLPGHKRTPTAAAYLTRAWGLWLKFALASGAITEEERAALWKRVRVAIQEVCSAQKDYQTSEDPARRFLEVIQASLMAGKCHVTTMDNQPPKNSASWGWRSGEPQGECIGWLVDDATLYLNPDAAHNAATKAGGADVTITATTLWKRLRQAGCLIVETGQDSNLVRKMVNGRRMRVLAIPADKLESGAETDGATDDEGENEG